MAGQFIVGGILSETVTVWLHVAVSPALSVTVQITVVVPSGKTVGALFVTEATPQLSFVTGTPRFTEVAVHPEFVKTEIAAGQVMVGGKLSETVTVWLQVAVKPELSVTVQITVVVPSGKAVGALLVTEATPQLSFVTGTPRFTEVAEHPEFVKTETAAGQVMVGGTLSETVTV